MSNTPIDRTRGLEVRLGLTQAGYLKLLPKMDADEGWTVRHDLYLDGWDGNGFVFGDGDGPRTVLRIKRKELGAGHDASFEVSLATSTDAPVRSGSVTLQRATSCGAPVSADTGKRVMDEGDAIIQDLLSGKSVSPATLTAFGTHIEELLAETGLRREMKGLPGGGDKATTWTWVPSHSNTKLRVQTTLPGKKGIGGELNAQVGETFDWDPKTGEPRVRFELEVEPDRMTKKNEDRELLRTVQEALRLDDLAESDQVNELPKAQDRIAEALRRLKGRSRSPGRPSDKL